MNVGITEIKEEQQETLPLDIITIQIKGHGNYICYGDEVKQTIQLLSDHVVQKSVKEKKKKTAQRNKQLNKDHI